MAIIGKINTLSVVRDAPPGLYLDGGALGEILLPGRYIPKGIVAGDFLDVFLYRDSEDRLVATTERPHAVVGEFVCLKVVSVNQKVGAFLDWGLAKDLLLPFREQVGSVRVGQSVVVYIYLDSRSDRIVSTMRYKNHMKKIAPRYERGHEVNVLVTHETPLGYNAIVENAHFGLLYHSNLSGRLEIGQRMKGYVQTVRTDGNIDLRLDASGYQKVGSLRDQVWHALQKNGGRLEFDDKSSPEAIRKTFGTSKNAFKLVLSSLYKERLVCFRNSGVELVKT